MRFLLCAGALALAAAGGVAAWRFKGHVRIALMQAGIAPQRTVAHRTVEESQMGGDIYVHGGSSSIGCLAIGDDAIEEVFCLLAQVR